MTPRTKQAILMLSVIPGIIAGATAEWSVRTQLDTPAGWVPVWVLLTTIIITNAVLRWLVSVVKRNNP